MMYNKIIFFIGLVLLAANLNGQIKDPNLKLAAKFENSLVTINPATATVMNGSAIYNDGLIGNCYEVDNTLNGIDLGCDVNICDITDEYTVIFRIKAAGVGGSYTSYNGAATRIFQLQGNFTSVTKDGITIMWASDSRGLMIGVESSRAGYGTGTPTARWSTGIQFIANEWLTVVCQRNATGARAYVIDAAGSWTEATISQTWNPQDFTFPPAGNWLNMIGGSDFSGCDVSPGYGYCELDEFFVWNTYLSYNDIKRVVSGFHPIQK